MEMIKKQVTNDDIHHFLSGTSEQEGIVKIECSNSEDVVSIIYRDKNGVKRIQRDSLYPFCWSKQSAARLMFGGDRERIKSEMSKKGIAVKGLETRNTNGEETERMKNGFRLLFYATKPMSHNEFLKFFKSAGTPIYGENDDETSEKQFLIVSPVEQYMIKTGKRFFKGVDNYDDLLRMEWDLETEGLDPNVNSISQIGIRTNKGYEKIITIEDENGKTKFENELNAIFEFFDVIKTIKPDIITGHNTENFDWNFINVRLSIHGFEMGEVSKSFLPNGVYKKNKESVLKLGGEMEYYYPTVMWGFNLTDSLFAVRRAQAIDSSMKKADLKYVTKYSKINKPNRVYVPGKIIDTTWADKEPNYAFNDENGHWFKITDSLLEKKYTDQTNDKEYFRYEKRDGKLVDCKEDEVFDIVTGRYIVQRYLLDDLWETDKVECRYNESNFLVGKMLPVSFEKMCTMGTAAIWKYIMMAWSYEQNLAVPSFIEARKFTGGLSRLLSVGFVDRVVKLDYNSLYPSIILTYGIKSPIDIMGAMSAMLEYILTQREHYKELKAEWGEKGSKLKKYLKENKDKLSKEEIEDINKKINEASLLKARNDKLQLPLKITGNGFFGSYGSGGGVFPWSDITCAEETTCVGRQALRLMISHFSNIGNRSVEYKTVNKNINNENTLFFTKKDNRISIKTIDEVYNSADNRDYKILCNNGWDNNPNDINNIFKDFNYVENCESVDDFLNGTIENKIKYYNRIKDSRDIVERAQAEFLIKCISYVKQE